MATIPDTRRRTRWSRPSSRELTVVDPKGRPVTYPLIPLWDGERIYMTSSTLFSRKLEHIARNPQRVRVGHGSRSASVAGRTA